MLDFTFLTEEQVFGDKKLDILKQYGVKSAITDFAILLGGGVDDFRFAHEDVDLINRTCYYWTKTIFNNNVVIVNSDGKKIIDGGLDRVIGSRLVVPYSSICTSSRGVKYVNGIIEKEFGEYPQTVASKELSFLLEEFYNEGKLKTTGKLYTTDSNSVFDDVDSLFRPRNHIEYEYNGYKYVRFKADNNGEYERLSNGVEIKNGDIFWVKVEPIKWLIDEKNDIALSKNVLFAGVQFNRENDISDFKKTDVKRFIDTYFSKEILTQYEYDKLYNVTKEDSVYNPYNFDFTEVSEEEIIRGAVESNIAVFLHGKSSEGKSARVKQIDPNCEIIYLRNATPDSLNGKSVFNSTTNEMIDIPPTWYKKVVEKCEAEPEKIHIVFFDEITNALPSIQGMAFNIVLDGEVNGIWKLPDNARIVAAGNDLEDSKAAQEMAEPLFNRFAHVYINTTVDDWLKWASTPTDEYERLDYKQEELPRKIHPSIYAYIAYKGESVLRTKYDGLKPNADPRKWEMASKVLYTTNKPEMIRSLVGEEISKEFTEFCREKVITIEDVLNGNYTDRDLDMNTSQKYNTAVGLSSVAIEHFEIVRNFVKRLGPEICATFDTLWAHGIEERLEKIQEIKLSERTK